MNVTFAETGAIDESGIEVEVFVAGKSVGFLRIDLGSWTHLREVEDPEVLALLATERSD